MSETVEQQGQGEVQNEVGTKLAEMQEQLERLQSTNQRLLEESKSYKTKAQKSAEELESIERQKLQEAGKLEELLELERNKAHQAESRAKTLERETMKRALELEVATRAKDAFDVRDILGSINPEVVSYDETTGSFKGVDDALEDVRSKKPYLFQSTQVPSTPGGRPSAQVPKDKSLDERISDNPGSVLQEVLTDYFTKK